MRTTIVIDPDVEAEVERLRREEGFGLSEAVNELARRGMVAVAADEPYSMSPRALGAKIDVTNVGEVLGMLDDLET